jgi:GT2 family glycosyltransferase
MPECPKVSVILPVHNGLNYIDRCLRSVLETRYDALEVIVVDDVSTDGTLDHVRHNFPSVTVVANEQKLGYAGGINSGLRCATGEYVAPLNVDTEVERNWLKPMVDFLERNPSAGAVTPKILLDQDRSRVNTMGANTHITGLSFCRYPNQMSTDVPDIPERVPGISGASFVIRKEVLKQAGGAPEECFMMNDDVILSWTLNLMGYDLYCLPQSLIYHDYQLVLSSEKMFLLERNRLAMLFSCLKVSTLLIGFPFLVLSEMAIVIYNLLKGSAYLQAKLKAYLAVWRDRNSIRGRRERIQKLRRISDWELFGRLSKNLDWRQLLGLLGQDALR